MSAWRAARLDRFRVLCAVLVIAIHTSPLETLSPDADWLLTRVIARVAVPCFFLATGYFSRDALTSGGLGPGLRKLAALYLAAVLLYLPLNLYMGDLEGLTLGTLLRDLLLDGTFYHLWYFPAVIMGLLIVRGGVRLLGWGRAGILMMLLYGVGLGGDSWHGLAVLLPGGEAFYNALFQWMDYTRNGLFFAPVYLWAGGCLRGVSIDRGACLTGLLLSACALFAEAALLRYAWLARFDSMYLSLLPVSVCLFGFLTADEPGNCKELRVFSLLLYIVHPWCIVGLRVLARPLHLWGLLVENRLTAFLAVCLVSAAVSAAGTRLWAKLRPS